MTKWGFRRCEDIVWLKTNRTPRSNVRTKLPRWTLCQTDVNGWAPRTRDPSDCAGDRLPREGRRAAAHDGALPDGHQGHGEARRGRSLCSCQLRHRRHCQRRAAARQYGRRWKRRGASNRQLTAITFAAHDRPDRQARPSRRSCTASSSTFARAAAGWSCLARTATSAPAGSRWERTSRRPTWTWRPMLITSGRTAATTSLLVRRRCPQRCQPDRRRAHWRVSAPAVCACRGRARHDAPHRRAAAAVAAAPGGTDAAAPAPFLCATRGRAGSAARAGGPRRPRRAAARAQHAQLGASGRAASSAPAAHLRARP